MERAWSLTRGGDVTVAVVDSGIAEANPHFDGALAAGVDLTRAGGATEDASGQGTAVAGAIGARSVSGSGLVGLASEATPSSALATGYAGGVAALVAAAHPDETPADWTYRLTVTALRTTPAE